jgi:magnesium chelatase family protein
MGNGPEAAWAGELEILAAPSLIALVNHVKGTQVLTPPSPKMVGDSRAVPDLKDVKGQDWPNARWRSRRRADTIC